VVAEPTLAPRCAMEGLLSLLLRVCVIEGVVNIGVDCLQGRECFVLLFAEECCEVEQESSALIYADSAAAMVGNLAAEYMCIKRARLS
jgi:hypothetical protein